MTLRQTVTIAAAVAGFSLLTNARQLAAQDLGPTVEVIGGYSRLYHSNGAEFDFAIMKPIGHPGKVEHRVGLVVRVAESDLATITFVRDQRHMIGAGIRYALIADGGASLSPFVGATVQVVHASTTDNSFLESGHPTATQPNPEDYVGLNTTGPVIAAETGIAIRLSPKARALLRGSLEYQAVYTNPSTHIVWGFSAGMALAI